MSSTTSQLGPIAQRTANALQSELGGTATVVIATADGFALGQAGPHGAESARIAAMVSSIAALGEAASHETGIGRTKCMVVDSTTGRLVLRCIRVRDESVLVVLLTDTKTLMGLVLNHLVKAEQLMNAA